MLQTLKKAVQKSCVVLGSQSMMGRLSRGIPQGGRFSPFLCALHMSGGDAQLPLEVSQELRAGRSLLARLVDDFLYMAHTPEAVCRFLSHLARPNAYGGELNWSKLKANFVLCRQMEPVNIWPKASKNCREVNWAGLTVCPEQGKLNVGAPAALP